MTSTRKVKNWDTLSPYPQPFNYSVNPAPWTSLVDLDTSTPEITLDFHQKPEQ